MNSQKRINPDFDRLSDLVYLSSLEKLEAAILAEGHTDSELSEALSEIIAELEAVIKNINAEISQKGRQPIVTISTVASSFRISPVGTGGDHNPTSVSFHPPNTTYCGHRAEVYKLI